MRLKRSSLIVAICLVIWGTLTYYALIRRLEEPSAVLELEIGRLEAGINEQMAQNKEMIGKVQGILSRKKIGESERQNSLKNVVIPVLVFACNRVSVSRCLDKLIQYRPNPDQFPIIVSQDCNHAPTSDIIESYGSQVTLIKQPDQSEIPVKPAEKKFKGYFKIARHYGWALNQTFFNFNFDVAIIVEDDLEVSPDFFEYFMATYPLLLQDDSLWCISAWNDNGKDGLVNSGQPELLYRTDFFPGLGWMLTKSVWMELSTKWPKAYWDDWIRQPIQRKDRACIRPEISRTKTFGKIGVSNGMYFDKHLKFIKLNDKFVPFTKMDLSYLLKETYDKDFLRTVNQSPVETFENLKLGDIDRDGPVRIVYHTKDGFKSNAKGMGLMDDFRAGVPRMAYRGVVTFYYKKRTVFLAPGWNWKGYDLSWT
ncbi:alpha-1,3-mannosyl-glycoprotein 2-beta-N-acetylglucosaminyltransferase [Onthophagus taurus]|uniref:alpha-1,3-mannosyl-glycoprotein 2-beta-N-acetylglucosaminyltransferase n=1 Tax=Onthophagus taurus TaxID=166361 RepID=UPI000C202A1B|nr:alpha-1,3-mannosyl-glycoprotein 2-beta-N-acetylglucosaminyltransferase [Onthophagus taurus]